MRSAVIFLCLLLSSSLQEQNVNPEESSTQGPPPDLEDDAEMLKHLSPSAFFSMKENMKAMGPLGYMNQGMGAGVGMGPEASDTRDGKKGYEQFDLATLDNMARSINDTLIENFALVGHSSLRDIDNRNVIYHLCYCLTYIWRRARQSIRKYFHLRDIYHNHIEYEVGYITYVINAKYQNMLELYAHYSYAVEKGLDSWLSKYNRAPIILEGEQIKHLCNILHELKAKYQIRPYNPENKFEIPPFNLKADGMSDEDDDRGGERIGKERSEPKGYIAKQVEEVHKLIDEEAERKKKRLQNAREYYKKHGHYPTTTQTQQPMRLWSPNLDYEWSGEDDDKW